MSISSLESMNDKEIYERVYNWYTNTGVNLLKSENQNLNAEYRQRSAELIEQMPEPEQSAIEDYFFVFQMISSDLLEWAFREADEFGISMGNYARYALERKEAEIGFDELFSFLRKSSLFKEFSRVF